ncbi:MAG TPA: hypothetical protein VHG30_18875, partial [Microvirga sp.]|nr:hypothetical protein [Microvirga sp.]
VPPPAAAPGSRGFSARVAKHAMQYSRNSAAVPLRAGFPIPAGQRKEETMFDRVTLAGEAMRASLGQGPGMLIPALHGCVACGVVRMIAAPGAGACLECGAELTVLDADEVVASETPATATASREAA